MRDERWIASHKDQINAIYKVLMKYNSMFAYSDKKVYTPDQIATYYDLLDGLKLSTEVLDRAMYELSLGNSVFPTLKRLRDKLLTLKSTIVTAPEKTYLVVSKRLFNINCIERSDILPMLMSGQILETIPQSRIKEYLKLVVGNTMFHEVAYCQLYREGVKLNLAPKIMDRKLWIFCGIKKADPKEMSDTIKKLKAIVRGNDGR